MGKIFDAIDRQIIAPKVKASYQEGFEKTKEAIQSFYSQGNAKYVRTGLSPSGCKWDGSLSL